MHLLLLMDDMFDLISIGFAELWETGRKWTIFWSPTEFEPAAISFASWQLRTFGHNWHMTSLVLNYTMKEYE